MVAAGTGGGGARTHHNAFGFLRLVLASLVIVSHVPELVDGDAGRELLTRWTGTQTFGAIAVDGFFLISGCLIAQSFLASRSLTSYLAKRVARIYPGFLVSSLVCLLLVAPIAGGNLSQGRINTVLGSAQAMVRLHQPFVAGTFATLNYPQLNGAAWTIQYEFACYLMVIALGWAGLLRRGWAMAGLAAAMLLLAPYLSGRPGDAPVPFGFPYVFDGAPRTMLRLPGMFVAGIAFGAFGERMRVSWRLSALAALGLAATIASSALTEVGIAAFGGYLLFAAARAGGGTPLQRINNPEDISYGLYLYAWPAQQLLMLAGLTALLPLGMATWLIAAACGWLSWRLVERPAQDWARGRGGRDAGRGRAAMASPRAH